MKLYAATRVIFCGGFLFVVMSLAVVMTAGVTVNDGAVEKHRQDLFRTSLATIESLQLFFQQLRRIGHTTSALAEDNTRTYALEHLALGGTVALLELGHDLPHGFSSSCPILFSQSQHDARPDKCATSTFHGAHTPAKGVAKITTCLFIDSD